MVYIISCGLNRLVFRLGGAWFAALSTDIDCRIGRSEMAMVLATMMSLVILTGVAICVLFLQNYFDHFTDVFLSVEISIDIFYL